MAGQVVDFDRILESRLGSSEIENRQSSIETLRREEPFRGTCLRLGYGMASAEGGTVGRS